MGKIGCFVESYNFVNSDEVEALNKFRDAANQLGHNFDFIRKKDLDKIKNYDALFIRAYTMVGNSAYLAARMAETEGIPVIDDSSSILTCCDKVHLHKLFLKKRVAVPETLIYQVNGYKRQEIEEYFSELGSPLVIKAPHSSFSKRVEKACTIGDFIRIVKRYSRQTSMVLVQEFIKTEFDWRVGVLNRKPLYACRYIFPKGSWKMMGKYSKQAECDVEAVPISRVPKHVLKEALKAASAVGKGLYGVDVKRLNGSVLVIEVNDNPTLESNQEDRCSPMLYTQIIEHLL